MMSRLLHTALTVTGTRPGTPTLMGGWGRLGWGRLAAAAPLTLLARGGIQEQTCAIGFPTPRPTTAARRTEAADDLVVAVGEQQLVA